MARDRRPPRSPRRGASSSAASPRRQRHRTSPARPAALTEGRLIQIALPSTARVGDALTLEVAGRESVVLVEGTDIVAWDLDAPGDTEVGPLLQDRVRRALARRSALLPAGTSVYRAVHDAADRLPGVIVDVFADVAVCQIYGAAYRDYAGDLAAPLLERHRAVRVVHRSRHGAHAAGFDHWFGQRPRGRTVLEEGIRFWIRFDDTVLGTGLFPDQRGQRARVRALARGRTVLNLFAYAGGFTVAAALGGAARVDHVDLSRACLAWARRNLALNGINSGAHRFFADDARSFVRRAIRRGDRYQLLVVDPPTFAVGRKPFRTPRDLGPLLRDCAGVLDDGALILVCASARGLTPAELVSTSSAQLEAGGGRLYLLGEGSQGFDHPLPALDSPLRHLKAAWFLVERG